MEKAKRGYQEKKQILLKHVETEKKLHAQGKQLIDVANIATKDVKGLHETIDRRKNFENINREACKNLDNNLNSHLASMTNNLGEYRMALNDQTLSLIKKMGKKFDLKLVFFSIIHLLIRCILFGIDSNTKQSKELCGMMLAKLSTLIEAEQHGKRVIEECLADGKTEIDEIFRKHLEEKEKILKTAEEQRDVLKKKYIELQANVDDSYAQFDQSQLSLQNLVSI